MKVNLSAQSYQWTDDSGAYHVGRIVLYYLRSLVLVQHWPTGDLEIVAEHRLKLYPSEPIPEPEVRT